MTDAPIELMLTAACPDPEAGCAPVAHEGPWDPPLVEWDAAPQDAAPQDAAPQDAAPQDAAPQDAAPQDAAPEDAARVAPDASINPVAPPERSGCAARPGTPSALGALAVALVGALAARRSRRRA